MLTYKLRKSLKKICQSIFRIVSNSPKKKSLYFLNYGSPAIKYVPQYQSRFPESAVKYGDLKNIKSLKLHYPYCWNNCFVRRYSRPANDDFPALTDFPVKSYPGLFTDLQNFLITHMTIRQQLDPTFSNREFMASTKKVVQIISNRLAQGDVDYIENLVTEDVFRQIKKNLPTFSPNQRQDLIVNENEIVISFLRDMTIYNDTATNGKFLEILTIHHVAKGIEEVQKATESFNPFQGMQGMAGSNQIKITPPRVYVLNYRFIRKFTSTGNGGDWTINGLNHVPSHKVGFSFF